MDQSMKPLDAVYGGAFAQQRQRVLRNTYALLALSMVPTVLGVGLWLAGGWAYLVWGLCVSTVLLWHAT